MLNNVTVLVAVLNKAETIKSCIESILRLESTPARIMVVDGFSRDGTAELLQGYTDKIDLYRVKGNLSTALNWAFDRISTEYVALTDGDCVVDSQWLAELLGGFAEAGVIATAGYCGTPPGLPLLPTLVGLELENRFKLFPDYILRAPTMNLALKTELACKVRFDENIQVGVEVDFGYRYTKLGKMRYCSTARIWHYHRASWQTYFKQQHDQVKGAIWSLQKHRQLLRGDHISSLGMMLQIPLMALTLGFIFFSFLNYRFLIPAALFGLLLFFLYGKIVGAITPKQRLYPPLFLLFIFRNLAWVMGAVKGTCRYYWERQRRSED